MLSRIEHEKERPYAAYLYTPPNSINQSAAHCDAVLCVSQQLDEKGGLNDDGGGVVLIVGSRRLGEQDRTGKVWRAKNFPSSTSTFNDATSLCNALSSSLEFSGYLFSRLKRIGSFILGKYDESGAKTEAVPKHR
jgi:hypothetical protein